MSLIANKTALMYSDTAYASMGQITVGTSPNEETLCINEYPDLGNEQPDQVECTSLCDDTHKFIDGLKNLPEELAFPCNYSKALYEEMIKSAYQSEAYWGVYFGDTSGTEGKIQFKGKVTRVVINGAGNGELRTMTVYIKPMSSFSLGA